MFKIDFSESNLIFLVGAYEPDLNYILQDWQNKNNAFVGDVYGMYHRKSISSRVSLPFPERRLHPWHVIPLIERLNELAGEGKQILATTFCLHIVRQLTPQQLCVVERVSGEGVDNDEGLPYKLIVKKLPIDSLRFKTAFDAYDGDLAELWYTNVFGGNPINEVDLDA